MIQYVPDDPASVEDDALREEYDALAAEIISGDDFPSVEEVERYFQLGSRMPQPDFSARFESERASNTRAYQEAMEKAKEAAGNILLFPSTLTPR